MSIEKLNELADKKWDFEAAVRKVNDETKVIKYDNCLLYTSPSPRD